MHLRLSFSDDAYIGQFIIDKNPETIFTGNLNILIQQKKHIPLKYIDEYLKLEEEITTYIEKQKE